MTTSAQSLGEIKQPWKWIAAGGAILLIWGMVAFPRMATIRETTSSTKSEPVSDYLSPTRESHSVALFQDSTATKAQAAAAGAVASIPANREIIRTGTIEMVVVQPSEAAEKIRELAENMGGYLESSDGGGPDATTGTLTIRVPSAHFEQARAAIRKLCVRVDSEKIKAEDVTQQYVDQEATLRNLRAEEAQYLAILKKAGTVKDMLSVTGNLSEVRGQIEQQQAEFNALSRQVETVALTISLRTEVQVPVSWLNWRPGYKLKLALHDGLDSVADYATVMIGILFYLPATLLWLGTIVVALVIGWRTLRWARRRWSGWTPTPLNG